MKKQLSNVLLAILLVIIGAILGIILMGNPIVSNFFIPIQNYSNSSAIDFIIVLSSISGNIIVAIYLRFFFMEDIRVKYREEYRMRVELSVKEKTNNLLWSLENHDELIGAEQTNYVVKELDVLVTELMKLDRELFLQSIYDFYEIKDLLFHKSIDSSTSVSLQDKLKSILLKI